MNDPDQSDVKRIWNLPALRDCKMWSPWLPEVIFRYHHRKFYTSGHCTPQLRRCVVTVGRSPGHAHGVLLHELMHAVLGGEGHSARFWSLLRSAAREAWPAVDFDFPNLTASRGWRVDRWIGERINEHEILAGRPVWDPSDPRWATR